jgi:hypothetical protein
MDSTSLERALKDIFKQRHPLITDSPFSGNVADGLFAIAAAIQKLASEVNNVAEELRNTREQED